MSISCGITIQMAVQFVKISFSTPALAYKTLFVFKKIN